MRDVALFLSKVRKPTKILRVTFFGANNSVMLSYRPYYLELKFKTGEAAEKFYREVLSAKCPNTDKFVNRVMEIIKKLREEIVKAKFFEISIYAFTR